MSAACQPSWNVVTFGINARHPENRRPWELRGVIREAGNEQ
jgi:hypothetical protein